jgi:hypothetical protein
VGEPAIGPSGFSGDDGRTTIFDYAAIPELRKWYNHGKCDGANLSEDQQLLRKTYADLFHLVYKYPVFSNGLLYDLMWVNADIPQRDKIFAFLRYGGSEDDKVFLVVACFDKSIGETKIKIPEHALQTIGFENRLRITIESIEPQRSLKEVQLLSQIVTVGLKVLLNHAGYAIISLT